MTRIPHWAATTLDHQFLAAIRQTVVVFPPVEKAQEGSSSFQSTFESSSTRPISRDFEHVSRKPQQPFHQSSSDYSRSSQQAYHSSALLFLKRYVTLRTKKPREGVINHWFVTSGTFMLLRIVLLFPPIQIALPFLFRRQSSIGSSSFPTPKRANQLLRFDHSV